MTSEDTDQAVILPEIWKQENEKNDTSLSASEEKQSLSLRNQNLNLAISGDKEKEITETLENEGLGISELAKKTQDTIFHYEKAREEMEKQGITDEWIISQLKDIAMNAIISTKEGVFPDYKARRTAINDLAKMAKKSGSTEGIASTIKQLMQAQGAKNGDGTVINFTKFLYGET